MPEKFIDFRIVKERVSIEAVLDHYNIRLRRVNSFSLRGRCPLPTHSSEKSAESFSVQTGKNIWACQSSSCAGSRGGKKGGNVIDLVAIMESCSIRDAATKLDERFLSSSSPSQPKPTSSVGGKETKKLVSKTERDDDGEVNTPLSFTLKDVQFAHPYLESRGITEAVAEYFGVGFFPGKGSMRGRIVIPIHDVKGNLVAYGGRAIDTSEPKYKLPSGFKKSVELWNLHRVLAGVQSARWGRELVVVVEGFFDCMHVHHAGVPYVVALMGSTMSEVQEKYLHQFSHVMIMLDGDDAGRVGAQSIASRLVHRTFVKVIDLPDGKQPDQLASSEIKTILGLC